MKKKPIPPKSKTINYSSISEDLKLILKVFIIAIMLWFGITITIQAFICPEMTNTELILNSPNSFILNFKK